jgi:dTDP-4-dehydrorhamnose 3,5-epimerase-like enzyme
MDTLGEPASQPRTLPVFADQRGALTLADFSSLPFEPARAYVLHAIPVGARRGGHAHRLQHRLIAVVSGSARVLEDDGRTQRTRELGAGESVHVPPMVWYELEALGEGLVMLVLASGEYDPDDYVHEREAMLRLAAATS